MFGRVLERIKDDKHSFAKIWGQRRRQQGSHTEMCQAELHPDLGMAGFLSQSAQAFSKDALNK